MPAVSASASRDKSGAMHVTMSNLDPNRDADRHRRRAGREARAARRDAFSPAPTMDAYNSFEHPDAVKPAPFTGARVANGQLTVTLPAHSVIVLELR